MKRKPAARVEHKHDHRMRSVNAAKPKLQRTGRHQAGAKRNRHDRGIRLNDFLDLPDKLRAKLSRCLWKGPTFEDIVDVHQREHISEEKGESEGNPTALRGSGEAAFPRQPLAFRRSV